MKKYQKNLFLGMLIVLSAFIGIVIEYTEKQSYILNVKTEAGAPDISEMLQVTSEVYENVTNVPQQTPHTKININTASESELVTLYDIGEKRAKAIITYRTANGKFEVIEDIMKIKGIGRKTFEKLKDYITVE